MPLKATFNQGIDEISSTQKEKLGAVRWDSGNKYVYSQNTADVTLRLGETLITVNPLAATHYSFDAVATNTAAEGDYAIKQVISVTAGDTITGGEFAGWDVFVDDGTGISQVGRIEKNTGGLVSATVKLYLTAALTTALTAVGNSDITIIPRDVVTETPGDSLIAPVVGVAPMAVTASYYFWRVKEGVVPVLMDEANGLGGARGEAICPSDATAGEAESVPNGTNLEDAFVFGHIEMPAKSTSTHALAMCRIKC